MDRLPEPVPAPLPVDGLCAGPQERWSPDDVDRYSVFSDLWRRGYYITAGHAFASDWLVYSGP